MYCRKKILPVKRHVRKFLICICAQERMNAKEKVGEILALADIELNGPDPWDMQVHDERFYQRALSHGSMGLGESYMDGWWDVPQIDEFFSKVQKVQLNDKVKTFSVVWLAAKGRLVNRQTKWGSKRVARAHYDLGNDLYQAMLDKNMQYTCAYWPGAQTLDEAQENKLHLICRKLYLQPGMKVLELGCGFGGLARFMAKEYGCEVVSYNISREQLRFARQFCDGLPVRFEERDYREAVREPQFDRVVAVGLCEHIGPKNHRSFLELVRSKLKDEGLFLMHTIGSIKSRVNTDPWINKYIFPGSVIPSITQLGAAMEGIWVMEDWHNFGPDYDTTLLAWWKNFDSRYCTLDKQKYGKRFYRMWKLYLLMSAGAFRARRLHLWQIVLSKGNAAGYVPVR
jgi:cyclopropane-fatty-acyl-phospholipid synthase